MIDVNQLKSGDRVVLSSPRGDGVSRRRAAQFEGLYATVREALNHTVALYGSVGVVDDDVADKPGPVAVFRVGSRLTAAFQIRPDGTMRDDAGHAVYVEERLGRMGVG